jgi:cytochrome c peroxidase
MFRCFRFGFYLLSALFIAASLSPAQETAETGEEAAPEQPDLPGTAVPMDETQRKELVTWLRTEYAKPAAEWPKPDLDPDRPHREIGPIVDWKTDGTSDQRRLGLSLFFDPRLSKSQGVSCASCHEPQLGWSNGVAFSSGEHREQISRHPPTLTGIALQKSLFWDGRADTLEGQARDVILHPVEMNGNPDEVVARLTAEKEFYSPLFAKAFGDPEITFDRVLQAIAIFERNIQPGRTKFDKFAKGNHAAFSDSEVVGLHLFRTKARCMNCHMGEMFTDGEFHNLGLTYYGRKLEDLGRYKQTHLAEDVGKFRTPTLRNVGRTAPYMHNGVFPILEGILRLYNAGMPRPKPKEHQVNDPLFPTTSVHLKPLGLTAQELSDLKDFLLTLNEPPVRVLSPPIPQVRKEVADKEPRD